MRKKNPPRKAYPLTRHERQKYTRIAVPSTKRRKTAWIWQMPEANEVSDRGRLLALMRLSRSNQERQQIDRATLMSWRILLTGIVGGTVVTALGHVIPDPTWAMEWAVSFVVGAYVSLSLAVAVKSWRSEKWGEKAQTYEDAWVSLTLKGSQESPEPDAD